MELFIPAVPKDAIPHVYYPNPDWTEFPFLVPVLPEGAKEWLGGMAIAKTIIPWVIEWLVCYEGWLVTGRWNGGGILLESHHG